jgi:quinoprotein glucose dehydrogenase
MTQLLRSTLALGLTSIWAVALVAVVRGGGPAQGPTSPPSGATANWATYLGDSARTHYSTLTQINKNNVKALRQAWVYETGDRGEYQANNLIIDGVLFTASPTRKVIALDAATGKEIWKWDPASERPGAGAGRQRGLVHWANATGGEARLFTSVGNYLYALDPKSGTPIRSFGENGALHLGTGAGVRTDAPPLNITLNTPGLIYRDLYIVAGINNAAGSVRAYDVRTGAFRWVFHTIPRPGEFGYDTWPATGPGAAGGASNWTGAALDEARGIVYVPTESATPDFWSGDRQGANLFANSLVALDANTGKRLWHYQIVRHDTLDKDLPTPPVLLTVTHNGRRIDAVAQGTKHGLLFVFDRVTGQPLWPIEERAIAASELPGTSTWPTQPFPTRPAPLMRQRYTAADASTVSPTAATTTLQKFTVVGSHGAFPPPSLKESIIFPGFDGGMEWGGAAADPQGVYYVNVNEIPWLYQMIPTRRPDGSPLSLGERSYLIQCASCHGLDRRGDVANGFTSLVDLPTRQTATVVLDLLQRGGARMPSFSTVAEGQRRAIVDYLFGVEQPEAAYQAGGGRGGGRGAGPAIDPAPYAFTGFRRWQVEGYPAISPPWGTLQAVDLNTGEVKWKVPLGEYPELTAKGMAPTGTENYGGPVVTAAGLVFIGATADETIRAFDKDTGAVVWSAKLPFGGNATPSVYAINGKQYVVISAGGAKSGRPAGGSIVAFSLPD